ncbi:MAG TPA: hypothetical protein DCE42_11600 [Myxococcales bacterium]|nr:hypothetical protein [Deltaproteobacteria bacterium]MBU54793.1 hypothetical protein [Deltaproteobacteria bacterium]HAA55395.1 hypothetical protein [Myxococcales bacterium]
MKKQLMIQVMAFVCGLLVWGLSHVASACSSPRAGIYARTILPSDKSQNIPLNAQISVEYQYFAGFGRFGEWRDQEKIVLIKAGKEIDVEVKTFGQYSALNQRHLIILTPKQALMPSTEYEIHSRIAQTPCSEFASSPCVVGGLAKIGSFKTGTVTDTTAPSFQPAAKVSCGDVESCGHGACCGPYVRGSLSIRWSKAQNEAHADAIRYNIYQSNDMTKPMLTRVDGNGVTFYKTLSGGFHFPDWSHLGVASGKYVIRAVDIAGNEEQNNTLITHQCRWVEPPKEFSGHEVVTGVDGGEVIRERLFGEAVPKEPRPVDGGTKENTPIDAGNTPKCQGEKCAGEGGFACQSVPGQMSFGWLGLFLFLMFGGLRLMRARTPQQR